MGADIMLTVLSVLSAYDHKDGPFDQAIVEIANRYSEHTVHLFPLAPNIPSGKFIPSLNKPVIVNASCPPQQWETDSVVVLSLSVLPALNFVSTLPLSFRKDSPWTVGLYDNINNEHLAKLFETFFNRGIVNVVVVTLQRSKARVHTYKPFRAHNNEEDGCYNFQPVIIDEWDSHGLLRFSEMFPKNKVDNVQNCELKSMIFTVAPYLLYSKKSGKYPIEGTAVELFQALHAKMNFTPAFSKVNNISGAVNEIERTPTIIAFGMGPTAGVGHRTEMSYRCVSWCAPTFVKDIRGWDALTSTFGIDLWLLCIVSVIASAVATNLLVRFSKYESRIKTYPSWLIVWNIVLEAPLPAPRQAKLRVFFISFCLAFLVIGTAFKARLHVLLSSAPSAERFSTLSQLYESELELVFDIPYKWLLRTIWNEPFFKMRSRLIDSTKVKSVLEYLVNIVNQGSAVFVGDSFCNIIANALGKTDAGYYRAYHVPECFVVSGGIGFGFSPESPFSKRINSITYSLRESGLCDKILVTSLARDVLLAKQDAIKLSDIRAVFYILFVGSTVSLVVVVAEIVWKHIGKYYSKTQLQCSNYSES